MVEGDRELPERRKSGKEGIPPGEHSGMPSSIYER